MHDGAVSGELTDSFCSTDPVAARVFAKTTFFSDNRSDLARVSSPCLILQHRHDNLVPLAIGDYIHENLQDSTLKVLDVSGHCAHMSHPSLVIEAIHEYLRTPSPHP
ncbi:alpha/beta fold hydrolase [Methylobacter psychrophilus]|uniref:alpha/beta fold hydrolase n=1 Tax=Methylobacter psychrophilus TaxID=96941 RepID=UPI0021D4FA0D|nr:alpha/beta hydrolase [Methylobacter psychrophilus]